MSKTGLTSAAPKRRGPSRDVKLTLRIAAYHEAGHAVAAVVLTDRLRAQREKELAEEIEVLRLASVDPDATSERERLAGAEGDLRRIRSFRPLGVVSIMPRRGHEGRTVVRNLPFEVSSEGKGSPSEAEASVQITTALAGAASQWRFTQTRTFDGPDVAVVDRFLGLAAPGSERPVFLRLQRAVRRLVRRPDVERAVHALARTLMRQRRVSGKRAESLIRGALLAPTKGAT